MAAFPAIASERLETEERLKAVGPTNALPPALQRALATEDFAPLPAPGPQDWLAVHPEPGQTFEEFRRGQPNRPDEQRHIIYLQPLGKFPEKQSSSTEMLRLLAKTSMEHWARCGETLREPASVLPARRV